MKALLLCSLICTGCASSVATSNEVASDIAVRPVWIDNPEKGVVASAAVHIRGRVAQEELAILRAREELSRQQGVKIESQVNTSQQVVNDRTSLQSTKQTQETVSGVSVKAAMKGKWMDPNTRVIWVWMVPTE